jgi:hypothetical protein
VNATVLREYDQSIGRGALVDYELVIDSKTVRFSDVIVLSRNSAPCSTYLRVAEGGSAPNSLRKAANVSSRSHLLPGSLLEA